jgi:hypothetical protein
VHGDKDTFLLASILSDAKPAWIEHRPFSAGYDLIQRDVTGDPLFHHRTASKWHLWGQNRPLAVPSLMAACDDALAKLRRSWSGVIFQMPDNAKRARAEEAKLIASKRFRYETSNQTRWLELLRGGAIGEGRTHLEQHWAVIRRDDTLVLQLYSETRLVVELTAQPDGSWRGGALGDEGFEARLIPKEARGSWPSVNDRSAVAEVATLLEPSLFACGFDPKTSDELEAALSLLNRLFDDVPEQLASRLQTLPLCDTWRMTLEKLTHSLRASRDARLQRTVQDLVAPVVINPRHYSRLF